MKASRTIMALSLGVAFQGCAALSSVESTDLSAIKHGTPQYEVEAILGEPVEVSETELGRAVVYRYNRGMEPAANNFGNFMVFPIMWPLAEYMAHQRKDKQREPLTVLYNDDGHVSSAFKGRQVNTLRRVGRGVGEAEYELGSTALRNANKWQWLCRAAHQGHWRAQLRVGINLQYGYQDFPVDQVKAYLWYSLADNTGTATSGGGNQADQRSILARNRRDILAEQMTPEQIVDAERLVSDWTPNAAECEFTSPHPVE